MLGRRLGSLTDRVSRWAAFVDGDKDSRPRAGVHYCRAVRAERNTTVLYWRALRFRRMAGEVQRYLVQGIGVQHAKDSRRIDHD